MTRDSRPEVVGADLALGFLNRPEYPSVPESLLTSLAWNLFEFTEDSKLKSELKPGLVYIKRRGESRKITYFETAPNRETMLDWVLALSSAGIEVDGSSNYLGQAVADAIAGVSVDNANSQAAVPLSPNIALLQNLSGMLGRENPADLGLILEQLFALGNQAKVEQQPPASVAQLWLSAANMRIESDRFLRKIDEAAKSLFPLEVQLRNPEAATRTSTSSNVPIETPFSWFNQSWRQLTSDQWVLALPPRVWVDWANTVLRLALGMGFLYESLWFEKIARKVLSGQPTSWQELVDGIDIVLPWEGTSASVSLRNVAPMIGRPVKRAQLARNVILKWLSDEKQLDAGIESVLQLMVSDQDLMAELMSALRSNSDSTRPVAEAIRYSLLTRETVGKNADLYGLLLPKGPSGRTLTVSPAPEWITVVASLSCSAPGTSTTIGKVDQSLRHLGLNPKREELVSLLERAGMARGSADSDQGLLVQSAY
jgi:hypothetical protein